MILKGGKKLRTIEGLGASMMSLDYCPKALGSQMWFLGQWHDMVTSVYQERNFGVSESTGQSKAMCEETGVGFWIAIRGDSAEPGAVGVEGSGQL